MLTRLRDAIGGAADKLSLRLPNGWTVSQDTYSTATTIPPAFRRAGPWTASSSTTTGQGTRRSLSATRLRFLWYEIRTGQTLTDGDGPVQFGAVRYKMEFSEFAGLLYPIIGGGDSRSICRERSGRRATGREPLSGMRPETKPHALLRPLRAMQGRPGIVRGPLIPLRTYAAT